MSWRPQNTEPHRYDSGIYWDTHPDDVVSCCRQPSGHPVHDVACPQCNTAHGVTYSCPQEGPIS